MEWNKPWHARPVGWNLLPGWAESEKEPEVTFSIRETNKGLTLLKNEEELVCDVLPRRLFKTIQTHLHLDVASWSPDFVFIHSGVALSEHGLILLPGSSFAGKSTLVKALTELGCKYFSDEFAVVDREGLVHPFPRPSHIRGERGGKFIGPRKLGWSDSLTPQPASTIIFTQYVESGEWLPTKLKKARALVRLLEHTVSAKIRTQTSIKLLTKLLDKNPIAVESDRGEAKKAAEQLLSWLGS